MNFRREERQNLFYKHKRHLTKSKKCDIIRMYEIAALFFGALRVTPPEKLRNLQAGAALVIHLKNAEILYYRKNRQYWRAVAIHWRPSRLRKNNGRYDKAVRA